MKNPNKGKNIAIIATISIAVFSYLLFLAWVLYYGWTHNHNSLLRILTGIKPDMVLEMESQPEQADLLLFDPVTGHVYKCFEREDGNYQLWLYPDGNLQVVYYIEKDGEKE